MTTLFNLGSISKMRVPPEWQAGRLLRNETPGQVSQPYHLEGDEDITFATYYRGQPIAKISADEFQAVLKQPAHRIAFIQNYDKQTGKAEFEEFETLYIVLRHMSEDDVFQISDMYTKLLHGRMVLVVDGLWVTSGLRNMGIFMPGNSDCTEVDELHYFAPQAKFDKHLDKVVAIIESIEFRAER